MSEPAAARSEPSGSTVQQYWWLHDARWYQEVAKRFGFDAANEINQEVIEFVAYRIAAGTVRALQAPIQELSWAEVVDLIRALPSRMWPPEFVDYVYEDDGPGVLTTKVIKNFAIAMLRKAGTLDSYTCPCLRLRSGWLRGLGLDVRDDRIEACMLSGADTCTYHTVLGGFDTKTG